MLIVKLEYWPHGDAEAAKELDRMVITNDGTGTPELGNYTVGHFGGFRGRVEDWPRLKGIGGEISAWKLVLAALRALGHD